MAVVQIIVAVVTAFAVALVSIHLFFSDGDDATRALHSACEDRRPKRDGRFGLWVGASLGAGVAVYHWFPSVVNWLQHLR